MSQEFDSGVDIDLYPHQITSVNNLENIELKKRFELRDEFFIDTTMGIFGDLPGYGKSISIVSLLARDKMEWNLEEQFEYEEVYESGPSSTYMLKCKIKREKLDCNLIVCSTSIIGQWEKELKHSSICYHTIVKKADINMDPNDYHVVLCSSTMYNHLIDKFQTRVWKRFIFDEAASTHIPSMKSVYAGFYWFITATFPMLNKIKGRAHFIRKIFGNMTSSVFNSLLIKNDDEYVKASFSMPVPRTIIHECLNPGVFGVVRDIIPRDIVEMISAGDISGAIKFLGGGETDKNLIDVVTNKKQEELTNAKQKVKKYLKDKNKDTTHADRYDKWVKKEKELTDQLESIKERFDKILEDPCSICQSDLDKPIMVPCCQNIFCGVCLFEWLKNHKTCPLCRQNVNHSGLIHLVKKKQNEIRGDVSKCKIEIIFEDSDDEEEKNGKDEIRETRQVETRQVETRRVETRRVVERKTKAETVIDIINNNPNGKFIVFSSHDESFELVKPLCKENDIEVLELKGGRGSKENKLQKYQSGEVNVILLNSKFNGAGLNLQNTTDIILYHEMNQFIETQVIGRANRIGRVGELVIHRLV
jgi:SNF2 family DNA or RNA helicase